MKLSGLKFLLAAAVFIGAGSAFAQEKKLVLHAWGGVWGEGMKAAWFEPFEKATGIKVELRPQGSMMDSLAKLRAQKDNMDIDLWLTGMTPTILADEAGILASIPRAQISNARYLPPAMIGDKYVGVWSIFYGLVYNTQKVPFQIKNWNDLFDPRLKGKISVPHATGYSGKFIALLGWMGGGNEKNIDPAFVLAKKLMPSVAVISKSDPEAIKLLTSGEVDVATMMPPGNFIEIRKAGAQYAFVAPDPYVPANFNNFALLKGPNQANAIRFIDFVLGKDRQADFAERMAVIPANSEAALPKSLAAYTPGRDKLRYADEAVVTRDLNAWADRWNREVQVR